VLVTVLRSAVLKLDQVIAWLRQLESHLRVKDAVYLQVELDQFFVLHCVQLSLL